MSNESRWAVGRSLVGVFTAGPFVVYIAVTEGTLGMGSRQLLTNCRRSSTACRPESADQTAKSAFLPRSVPTRSRRVLWLDGTFLEGGRGCARQALEVGHGGRR